jgi:phosphoribosyl 1,2-cyclic phosphodiesterase
VGVHFTILGSGSAGNCTYVETDEARLLVDAGFSGRQIRQRLATLSRAPESLSGILITHEHADHVQGLTTIASKLNIPVYCNEHTARAITEQSGLRLPWRHFATGASFEIGDVTVDTFSVPHDAWDPVGFLLRAPGVNIGVLTDLGHATKLVIERVREANVLLLEANHDLKLLQEDTKRPWSTKQRILGRHGHLSNDAAAALAAEVVTARMTHLFLGHLSRDCNSPELALETVGARLEHCGAQHVHLAAAAQDTPCATVSF